MSNKCTIIYGMSGSLKLTTINSLYKTNFKVYSDTKPFFEYDEKYFNWSGRPNDSHLAIHRLLTLNLDGYLPKDEDIVIERGITDNLFCIPNRGISGLESYDDIKIDELVNLETNILLNRAGANNIDKILLVMEDKDFIESRVLNNKYRKAIYPDLDIYMKKQKEYIEFTEKWNKISKKIIVRDALNYIKMLNEYENSTSAIDYSNTSL